MKYIKPSFDKEAIEVKDIILASLDLSNGEILVEKGVIDVDIDTLFGLR